MRGWQTASGLFAASATPESPVSVLDPVDPINHTPFGCTRGYSVALSDLARHSLELLHVGGFARVTNHLDAADCRQFLVTLVVGDEDLRSGSLSPRGKGKAPVMSGQWPQASLPSIK